jgi:hypothetical protein
MLRSCSPPLLLLRMLSSSPQTLNPNPTFLTPMKSTTQTLNSSQNHNHPLLFSNNPKVSLSNSHKLPQNMTVSSCFSGSPSTDQLSISGAPGSNNSNPESTLVVVSFYKFADFPDYADMRKPLKELCEELVLCFYHYLSCFFFFFIYVVSNLDVYLNCNAVNLGFFFLIVLL